MRRPNRLRLALPLISIGLPSAPAHAAEPCLLAAPHRTPAWRGAVQCGAVFAAPPDLPSAFPLIPLSHPQRTRLVCSRPAVLFAVLVFCGVGADLFVCFQGSRSTSTARASCPTTSRSQRRPCGSSPPTGCRRVRPPGPSPGADVGRGEPRHSVPAQTWGGVEPRHSVPAQMWGGDEPRHSVPAQMWGGDEPSPGADVGRG